MRVCTIVHIYVFARARLYMCVCVSVVYEKSMHYIVSDVSGRRQRDVTRRRRRPVRTPRSIIKWSADRSVGRSADSFVRSFVRSFGASSFFSFYNIRTH